MYFGSAIQCVVPANFIAGWEQYAEDYCFVKNTYYVPIDQKIPWERSEQAKVLLNF